MNLPCLIGVDRCGLVGSDGETHHGVFDIGFLSAIPNLILMTPKDAIETKMMVNTAFIRNDAPYVMRFPRGQLKDAEVEITDVIEIGTWEKIHYHHYHQITVITYDMKVNQVKDLIQEFDLPVNLINARFIKPIDENLLDELAVDHQDLVIYETDLMIGSLGSLIAHYYSKKQKNMTIHYFGIDDHYTPQGDIPTLLRHEKISRDDLKELLEEKCREKRES